MVSFAIFIVSSVNPQGSKCWLSILVQIARLFWIVVTRQTIPIRNYLSNLEDRLTCILLSSTHVKIIEAGFLDVRCSKRNADRKIDGGDHIARLQKCTLLSMDYSEHVHLGYRFEDPHHSSKQWFKTLDDVATCGNQ